MIIFAEIYLIIMKRLFLVIVAIVFSSAIYSQEIVNSDKLWSIMEEHCQPWGSNYSTEFFRFDIDTIVEGKSYKKVWIAEDENHEEWFFYGTFIREEEGNVYYKEMFEEEGLIYNFNLEIGDSVVVNNPRAAGELTLMLAEIDSVELEVGTRERWRLVSSSYTDNEYWIRGIGSQAGVINSGTGVYGGLCGLFTLLCEKENEELVYQNADVGSCYVYITDMNERNYPENEDLFTISYNDVTKAVKLKVSDNTTKNIYISTITGNIITNQQIVNSSFTFAFSEYPAGLYVITVVEGARLSSKKIIIN